MDEKEKFEVLMKTSTNGFWNSGPKLLQHPSGTGTDYWDDDMVEQRAKKFTYSKTLTKFGLDSTTTLHSSTSFESIF